jgi:hypothetical protein
VTNGIPLGSSLLLPVVTVNCVQTLKDTLGNQGQLRTPVHKDAQVWSRLLGNGDVAVVLYNRNHTGGDGGPAIKIQLSFESVGFSLATKVVVRDLVKQANAGSFVGGYTSPPIPPAGVQMLRLSLAD